MVVQERQTTIWQTWIFRHQALALMLTHSRMRLKTLMSHLQAQELSTTAKGISHHSSSMSWALATLKYIANHPQNTSPCQLQ